MKDYLIIFFLGVFTLTTPALSKDFEIKDIEKIGFQKGDQQFYQMIGAIDGWSGTLDGDEVEIYVFESENKINEVFFSSLISKNLWKIYCSKSNVSLISKGENACKVLELRLK